MIEIPQDAEVNVRIISYDEQIISLSEFGINNPISPAQNSVSKSDDPAKIKFQYNETEYAKDQYLEKEIVTIDIVGTLRHTRFANVSVSPIFYNPVKNELKILNNIRVEIFFENSDLGKTAKMKSKYSSFYFNQSAINTINKDVFASKDLITNTPVTYVIVADRMFEQALQPFIEWKKFKGFEVIVGYTDVIGKTNSTIKTYLSNLYNNPEEGVNPPSFVVFVGDDQQIPAWDGVSDTHITDLYYCDYTSDNIPDVFYGRFSAQNVAQLTPQIDKTLEYEKYLMPDPSYLDEVIMVAGDDANYEMTHGNGQMNYGTGNYFNEENNIISNTFLQPLDNVTASTEIRALVSQGVAYTNYTAHCSPDGWASPIFEIADIAELTNSHKYGLMVGNCCQSNQFNDNCFGENILRAEDKGTIGYIGGTNSTYWDEDYHWGVGLTSSVTANPTYENSGRGAYDAMFHTKVNEVDPSTWFITQGQMVVAGNLAVESSNTTRKLYYWEIYTLMGDPSLIPYMGIPTAFTYTLNPEVLSIGTSKITITTTPYTYIAVHQNETRIGVAIADAQGKATIEFSEVLTAKEVTIVLSAQNKQTAIEKMLPIATDQPFVLLESCQTDAPVTASTINLSVTLKNVANLNSGYDAHNLTSTLTTESPYITINDNTESFDNLLAGLNILLENAFNVTIANNVPDQENISFKITTVTGDNKYEWSSNFKIVALAPVLQGELIEVVDFAGGLNFDSEPVTSAIGTELYTYNISVIETSGNQNGELDAGETATLKISTTNIGHTDLIEATAKISIVDEYVTIIGETTQTLNSLAVNQTTNNEFNIEINENTQFGHNAKFVYELTYLGYQKNIEINIPIGIQKEDFETGNLSEYPWATSESPKAWTIVNDITAQEGTYCAKSGGEGIDNMESELTLEIDVLAESEITFWFKTSSEKNYDYLKFYIDETEQPKWSGEIGWTEYTQTVPMGVHTLKWIYEKDSYMEDGEDCVWIDNISFPAHNVLVKNKAEITISAISIPEWLTLQDNGNGKATLSGIVPNIESTENIEIQATDGTFTNNQIFEINTKVITNINNSKTDGYSIYPNPANGMFYLNIDKFTNAEITIQDISGKIVLNQKINNQHSNIDLKNMSKGVYLVKLNIDNQNFFSKIVNK